MGASHLLADRKQGRLQERRDAGALGAAGRRQMDASQRSSETERRRATILFADITGFTGLNERFDIEDAYSIVSASLKLLDGIARKHGGTVDKYLGDCIMAMFGVPLAVEDAAKAAINAAIEMHNRIHEFNHEQGLAEPLDIHTGINSGKVVSGDISGPVIREFSVMGDAVNIAARLKDLAPKGQIWIGEEAHRHTRDTFEFRPLDALTLKGKSRKVRVYEVVSRREHLYRDVGRSHKRLSSELVGRDRELERLRRAVTELESGTGSVVSVVGEAGIGKSRLLAELRGSDATRNATWLEGRSLSIGSKLSYHPFADLLRSWAGIADGEDEATAVAHLRRRIAQLFGAVVEDLVFPLATMLGFLPSLQRQQTLEGADSDAMERLIIRGLGLMLRRLAHRKPLVLLLDDLHWADTSSIELLCSLLRLAAGHPILFLLAHRPEASDSLTSALAEAMRAAAIPGDEIRLAPLDRGAAEVMLDNLFAGGSLPHATRTLIEDRASGNPFYIEEVVLSLIDNDHVEVRDGNLWATDRLEAVVIPSTVEELLMARIDRLPLPARQVLHIASIVGRSSHQRIIASIAEDPALEEHLETLQDVQLLMRRERAGEIFWEFKHPLIQEVAYEAITRAKRRDYHRRIAESIEATLPEGRPGRSGMLAYHFSLGRDLERAEKYLFLAGDEAARLAASSEALDFLQEAAELFFQIHGEGGDPIRRAQIEKLIALAFFKRGKMVEGNQHFDRALQGLGEHVPSTGMRRNLEFASSLLRVLTDLYVPYRRRRPAATSLDQEVIDLMFFRAQAQVTADPARYLIDSLANIHRLNCVDPASVEGAGGMYAGAVGYLAYSGMSVGLDRRLLRVAANLVNADDPAESLMFGLMNFLHHLLRGDWDDRHVVDRVLIEENLGVGALWNVCTYLGLDVTRRVHQGRFAEAAEQLEVITKIEDHYAYDLAKSNRLGVTMFLQREKRELEDALRTAEEYYSSFDEDLLNLLGLGNKANIEILMGRLEDAEDSLERAEQIVQRARFLPPFQLGAYWQSRFWLDLERLEGSVGAGDRAALSSLCRRAKQSRRKALSNARHVAWRRPEAFRLAGRYEWLRGRPRRALKWWDTTMAETETLGTRPEAARTLAEVGVRLRARGEGGTRFRGLTAEECLARAEQLFEELGLSEERERLSTL